MSTDLLAFLKWYLTVTAAGVLVLPLACRFFGRLPDRGYSLAKPLGLLLIGYAFWMLGSLGLLRNDSAGILFAAGLVGALGAWWLGRAGLAELRGWLRSQLRLVIAVEVLFLAAFALMTWVRAHNPEIDGTEKPMEFMFINAIMRSPAFPPHDAWLSGHAISYYYFGYVLVASLARLTSTASAVAFNLGIALLFGLTAVASLGVVMNLIALVKSEVRGQGSEADRPADSPNLQSPNLLGSFWPALLGPLLVLVAGNFYGVLRIAHANGMLADLSVPVVRYDFAAAGDAASADASGVTFGPINFWEWLDLKGASARPGPPPAEFNWDPGFWWWFSGARVVHDRNLVGVETEAIDEMPAFSFILGDMHPHVLALPFVFVAMALALDWLLWGRGGLWLAEGGVSEVGGPASSAHLRLRTSDLPRFVDRLTVSAVVLGGLSFLNTWDFPIYWFLTSAALVAGWGLGRGWDEVLRGWRVWGGLALSLAVLSVLLYLPFYLTFQSQAGGVLPNLIYPTRFQQTVVMFGPVLIGVTLLVGWLARRGRAVIDRRAALWAGLGILGVLVLAALVLTLAASRNPALMAVVDSAIYPLSRAQATTFLLQRRAVDSLASLFPAAVIGLVVGLGVGVLRQPPAVSGPAGEAGSDPAGLRSPAVLMALAMVLTGALLLIGPEFVYLRDNFGTRMNTIFKFYFQTWALWGAASAFGLWYIAQRGAALARWLTAGVMSLAVAAGLLYTLPSLYSKTNNFAGPPTLDGMAFFAQLYPNDWAAIEWLADNVDDTAVVAEAVGGAYSVYESKIAMATGLPTVMGWLNHEGQWRGDYFARVLDREPDIRTLYQSRDWLTTQEILDRYNIEYVYIGPFERQKYNNREQGELLQQHKFDQNMRMVFQSGDTFIYQRLDSQPPVSN